MARRESTFMNMFLALGVITLVASSLLGGSYMATKEKIAAVKLEQKVAALKKVLPEFDSNPVEAKIVVQTDRGELTLYPATKDGVAVGCAVETYSYKGYSGKIALLAGFLPDGTILSVEVLEHKETPGLGSKMESGKSNFSEQFKGKNPQAFALTVKKDGGQVDAITAATISSRAYCDAVQAAYDAYMKNKTSEQGGA